MLERVRRRATEVERLMNSEYPPIRQFFEGILLDGERRGRAPVFPQHLYYWRREIPLEDGAIVRVYTLRRDDYAGEPPKARIYISVTHGQIRERQKLDPRNLLLEDPNPEKLGEVLSSLKEVKEALEQAGVVPSMTVLNSSPASQ